jgi:hypothetical protein
MYTGVAPTSIKTLWHGRFLQRPETSAGRAGILDLHLNLAARACVFGP